MRARLAFAFCFAVLLGTVYAQQRAKDNSDTMTVRGCLEKSRQNYIVVGRHGFTYALKGVGDHLDADVNHEIAVTGELTNDTKMGIRPEKAGSNPSDTVRAIDAPTLQVLEVSGDVRKISDRCTSH
ncbi:MAG TPA: hypothetical protein VMT53_05735 [Terriglobales bacterium]|nr:hypothetical protein [Terriglobales bacterium]